MAKAICVLEIALTAIFMVLSMSSPLLAFGGCVQKSPENPSLILGLLGAGIAASPLLRAWLKSNSRK